MNIFKRYKFAHMFDSFIGKIFYEAFDFTEKGFRIKIHKINDIIGFIPSPEYVNDGKYTVYDECISLYYSVDSNSFTFADYVGIRRRLFSVSDFALLKKTDLTDAKFYDIKDKYDELIKECLDYNKKKVSFDCANDVIKELFEV